METKTMPVTCLCSAKVVLIDSSEHSTTLCCPRCKHGVLVVNHPDFQATIVLEDFCRKRGDAPRQRPLDDRHFADSLVESLVLGRWPRPAIVIDFGIASPNHFGALHHAVKVGVTAYELDRVLGSGRAITQLTRGLPGQPYSNVTFLTVYDTMPRDFDDDDGE